MKTDADKMKQKHVAVLLGGWSAEREVSLVSGKAVIKALEELGHRVTAIDVQKDLQSIIKPLSGNDKPDIVFNALHGTGGEDGVIQGVLEIIGIPYTHSGVTASALAMDKPLTKMAVTQYGVRCPTDKIVTRDDLKQGYPMPPPFVIKPPAEGSSVGVRIIQSGDNLDFVDHEWNYGATVMVEKYIPGRELTVALLGEKGKARALAVTELRPHSGFYDYKNKYTDGMTEHLLPAPVPAEIYDACLQMAEKSYEAVGCQGAARIDIRWDDTMPGTTGLYFLELNTQPGLTPLSLVPEQAAYIKMPFNELVSWMLEHPTRPA
jgi:D-alanine-D-alanine ligase